MCEFEQVVAAHGDDCLFRGQTSHYVDKSGRPSITTSFSRNGCIPSYMQKWSLYSRMILYVLKGPDFDDTVTLEESQALLQHYGWRSSYLDFTSDYRVACWFASNAYSEQNCSAIVEDWQEVGVLALHRSARYEPTDDDGFLYVVSKQALQDCGIGIHTIERFRFSDFDSRLDRQKAVMVGHLNALPIQAIVGQYRVANSVLREVSGGLSQEFLFPGRDSDLMYKLLLSAPFEIPRHVRRALGQFGPYVRSVDIPEYDYVFEKRIRPLVAFYSPQYHFDQEGDGNAIVVRVPDHFLHHDDVDEPRSLDSVMSLMGQSSRLVIEADGLICLPSYSDKCLYLKGAVIERKAEAIIAISGLMIAHPGTTCQGIGPDSAWHYNVLPGRLERCEHEADCPCNQPRKHLFELSIVRKLEYAIKRELLVEEDGIYRVRDPETQQDVRADAALPRRST